MVRETGELIRLENFLDQVQLLLARPVPSVFPVSHGSGIDTDFVCQLLLGDAPSAAREGEAFGK